MPREPIWRIAVVVYMTWIFYAALGPPPSGPEIPHLDKLMHALSWGFMAFLCAQAWPELRLLHWLLPAAHGALTEVLQGLMVQGRHAEWLDFIADLVGIACGCALVAYARRRSRSPA
jgi:VanZ family protein